MYDRAERDLSFNLRVYPANDHEFRMMYTKLDVLTSLAYPNYKHPRGGEVEGPMRMQPPFTELYMAHIGNRGIGQFGFIKSITYTVNESGDWDALTALPRLFDIAITYQIINKKSPSMDTSFYPVRQQLEPKTHLDILKSAKAANERAAQIKKAAGRKAMLKDVKDLTNQTNVNQKAFEAELKKYGLTP